MSITDFIGLDWNNVGKPKDLPHKLARGLVDSVAFALAMYLAYLMHQGQVIIQPPFSLWILIPVVLIIKLLIFTILGIYRMSAAYFGLQDAVRLFKAVLVSSTILTIFAIFFWTMGTWQSILLLIVSDYLITLFFVGSIRAARRILSQQIRNNTAESLRRSLIAGAGSAGELTLRAILQQKEPASLPIGFIDDDPFKQGMTIHGVPILGTRQEIPRLVKKYNIQELLIAIPSAPPSTLREIAKIGRQTGLKRIRILPPLSSMINGKIAITDMREIQVEDLLGREPVRINTREIEFCFKGETVLITGGAGSIGSELCKQIAKFQPDRLVIMDQDETALFNLKQNMLRRFPALNLTVVVGDIQDKARVNNIFATFKPQMVFHSAAYKHVCMMEENLTEAARNNVLGTTVVGEAACLYGTEKFVLISTDKAVNPTCIMGATKRMAEIVIQNLNERNPSCRFVAVRFGNVLGSRGSVVPIFREQIEHGGPVTITDPKMRRYFMTPSEAAVLVLQAGAIGNGGEVLVLDMGEPIAILDLAKEMIQLAGLEPNKDIPIVFTKPSPGEKFFEDILTAEEGTIASQQQRIFIANTSRSSKNDPKNIRSSLKKLQKMIDNDDQQGVLRILCEMVPNFRPSESLLSPEDRQRPPLASSQTELDASSGIPPVIKSSQAAE